MSNGRIKKDYICPYCGSHYSDGAWSFDHVVPRDIGGPKVFKIIACGDCNIRLSREIEQGALGSSCIRGVYCDRVREGHTIQSRRKKKGVLPLHKGYGMSGGRKVRLIRNMATGDLELQYLDALGPPNPDVRQAIVPAPTPEPSDLVERLIAKIVLGTMTWLWGDSIGRTAGACDLRRSIWNETQSDHVHVLDSSDRHMTMISEEPGSDSTSPMSRADALDNRPDHTVCIFRDESIVFSLVNLFGELESMIFTVDDAISEQVPDDPIVLVVRTTKNSVDKMTFSEYAEYKARSTGKSVTFRITIPVSREQILGKSNDPCSKSSE